MTTLTRLEQGLAAAVGKEAVSTDPGLLEGFRRCLAPLPEGNPLMVVRPGSAEDVQKVVKAANEMGLNLVPSSSGGPRFKGGTVPSADGVIVDLSGMRGIINIDRRNKAAIIEPGVTFEQLKAETGKHGLKVLMPLLPKAGKSVLGSYLEREPITIPKYHWDMTDPLLCTELVFGSGDFFRTGAASGPGTVDEMLQAGLGLKNPLGPATTDIVRVVQGAQGTMAIVTWASIKLEIMPRVRKCFFVPDARLEGEIDFAYQVMRRRLTDEFFMVNAAALARMLSAEPGEIEKLQGRQAPYTTVFCLAGYNHLPEKRVAYLERDTAEVAQHCGVRIAREVPGCSAKAMASLIDGPCGEPYWKLRGGGGAYEVFFLTTLDRTPGFVSLMEGVLAEHGFPAGNLGLYIQPIQQGRACHMEFHLYFDPSDGKAASRAERGLPGGRREARGEPGLLLPALRALVGYRLRALSRHGQGPQGAEEDVRSQRRPQPGQALFRDHRGGVSDGFGGLPEGHVRMLALHRLPVERLQPHQELEVCQELPGRHALQLPRLLRRRADDHGPLHAAGPQRVERRRWRTSSTAASSAARATPRARSTGTTST